MKLFILINKFLVKNYQIKIFNNKKEMEKNIFSPNKTKNKNNFNKRLQTTINNNNSQTSLKNQIKTNNKKIIKLPTEISNEIEGQNLISNIILPKKETTKNEEKENFGEINEEYSLLLKEKLGGGSFGTVYKCINKKTKKEFAAKIESNSNNIPQLNNEYKILKKLENIEGIPKVYLLHKKNNSETIMIYDLLGPNLEDILQFTIKKKFTLKTCFMIFIEILNRLKNIHNIGYIHRDLKPENFLIDLHVRDNTIYLIDFGLSKKYIDFNTKSHIPFKKEKPIVGTIKYISINTHLTYEQSRRDDIESLLYIILYFFKGELPWDKIKYKTKEEKYEKIKELKIQFREKEEFKKLPYEISLMFENVYNLDFTDVPNYNILNHLAVKGINNLKNEEKNFDNLLDWQKIEFMNEPVFMIQEIKKKKREEKEKEEKENENKNNLDSNNENHCDKEFDSVNNGNKNNDNDNNIKNNSHNNIINNNNSSSSNNNNIRKTKTLDKKITNELNISNNNNFKNKRKMSNFFPIEKTKKKFITEK